MAPDTLRPTYVYIIVNTVALSKRPQYRYGTKYLTEH
jgi:hypothetical protein